MARNPYDMTEFWKAFDPEQMSKMFNPQAMMSMFQPPRGDMFDMESIIKANQRNFEAMAEANKSAAEAYKDMLDKQMEIFEKLTLAARQQYEWVEDTAGVDTMKTKTAAMNEAVEEALKLMQKLAETARQANEEAFTSVKGQVTEAVEEIAKKTPKPKG
ncbi:phasin family protein [Rhodobacteraceae bacterium CCMM004]|nr:phasin family protein [Rhodobacteraceae bacterium CCMM004]